MGYKSPVKLFQLRQQINLIYKIGISTLTLTSVNLT
jgi:hypothetical protein